MADEIEVGGRALRQLGEVMPEQAGPEVAPIYDDIRATLRVPLVNALFRVAAARPAELARGWTSVRDAVLNEPFANAADALRDMAVTEEARSVEREAWADWPDGDTLQRFTAAIHHVLPKLLIVATAWHTDRLHPAPAARLGRPIELGVADPGARLELVQPEPGGELGELFRRIQERHGHPLVASYFRGLARSPELLRAAWQRLEPHAGVPPWTARRDELVARATEHTEHLFEPAPQQALRDEHLRAALAVFRHRLIPDLLLDVTFIRAWLEGL